MQMPALSPTMQKGNLVKWNKKVGDEVKVGEILFEVETDKATVGYEVQDQGYVAKIIVQEGTNDVEVGTQVAIIVDNIKDIDYFKNSSSNEQPPQQKQESSGKKQEQQAPKEEIQKVQNIKYPSHQKISMPSLSPTMTSGKVKSWLKKEGDQLKEGDILCDIETDKASVGFEVQDKGYLAKILNNQTGIDMKVGDILAILVDKPEDIAAFKDYTGQQIPVNQTQNVEPQQIKQVTQEQNVQKQGDRIFVSPLAKKTANEKQIDISKIQGSGPNGRIIQSDVLSYKQPVKETTAPQINQDQKPVQAQKKASITQEENPSTEIPLSNIRKVIASRLLESKTTIPHYYLVKSINMDECLKLRQNLNQENNVKISVNDMLIKAASLACIDVPECNSQWHNTFIKKFQHCDVSVAVSTESGLITPIVFGANQKGLSEISKNVKSLAEKAKQNKLQPSEYIGGTFTISNLGMFGIDQFSAIINPPQSCILAVGKTEKKVIFDESNKEIPYKVVSQMTVTLSCDHRVVDGAVGAQWLNAFAKYLEKPFTMLL